MLASWNLKPQQRHVVFWNKKTSEMLIFTVEIVESGGRYFFKKLLFPLKLRL